MSAKKWTYEECELLRASFGYITNVALEKLLGRSIRAIAQKASELGLHRPRKQTDPRFVAERFDIADPELDSKRALKDDLQLIITSIDNAADKEYAKARIAAFYRRPIREISRMYEHSKL